MPDTLASINALEIEVPSVGTTAAGFPAIVATWRDLTPIRRRDLESAVKRTVRYLWLPAEAVRLHPDFLNGRLFQRSPAAFGVDNQTFANVISGLRYVLRRSGRLAPRPYGRETLAPAWRELYDLLPTEYARIELASFMHYATLASVEPASVTSGTVADFQAWCQTDRLMRPSNRRSRKVVHGWLQARATIPGWPDVQLKWESTRIRRSVPLESFPVSFQADMATWVASLSPSAPEEIFRMADDPRGAVAQNPRDPSPSGPVVFSCYRPLPPWSSRASLSQR